MKRAAFLAGLCLIAVGGPAGAFGTIRHFGQDAEHERITRHALQCTPTRRDMDCFATRTLDELAGRSGTFGAVGFPDNPRSGLIPEAKAHCDSGDYLPVRDYPQSQTQARARLDACRGWMEANLDRAVDMAAGLVDVDGQIVPAETKLNCKFGKDVSGAKCMTLQAFGTLLHASQDFYSHSNWTDRPAAGPTGPDNPPGLGKDGPAPWISLRTASAFPAGLITGCYDGFPEVAHCRGRVKHAGLNKDTGPIDPLIGVGTTPRGQVGDNFRRAVEAATADTTDKWGLLREKLVARYGKARADKMICALSKDAPAKRCV